MLNMLWYIMEYQSQIVLQKLIFYRWQFVNSVAYTLFLVVCKFSSLHTFPGSFVIQVFNCKEVQNRGHTQFGSQDCSDLGSV